MHNLTSRSLLGRPLVLASCMSCQSPSVHTPECTRCNRPHMRSPVALCLHTPNSTVSALLTAAKWNQSSKQLHGKLVFSVHHFARGTTRASTSNSSYKLNLYIYIYIYIFIFIHHNW